MDVIVELLQRSLAEKEPPAWPGDTQLGYTKTYLCSVPLAKLCFSLQILLLFIRGVKGACPEKLTCFQVIR